MYGRLLRFRGAASIRTPIWVLTRDPNLDRFAKHHDLIDGSQRESKNTDRLEDISMVIAFRPYLPITVSRLNGSQR